MASWYSNILTNTTSRITNLLGSEADGDTDDDTHVCRILRQYYTENGRPLPNWLPPDPKAPPPAPIIQQNSGPAASRYGAPQQGAQGGGLSSLWDQNRGAGRGAGAAAGSRNPFARNAATPDPAPVQARPLPSQRAGSVQSNSVDMGAGGGGGGASSAQDRLRQRLYGGGARTTSPSSSTGPFAPPPQQGGGRSRGGSAANAGSGDYDPYGPGGQFDSGSGGGGGNRYGGGGLPSGPRRMGGLPSGPRMR